MLRVCAGCGADVAELDGDDVDERQHPAHAVAPHGLALRRRLPLRHVRHPPFSAPQSLAIVTGAFAQAEDGVGYLRRYSQRSADYSTDGDRQYYDDRRYDHSRSALAPPPFPSGCWLTRARVRDRPSSNQQDGWGDAQDDMRQDDMRQDDSSREGHGDRAQSHARAGHSAAASSRRRRPRVPRPLPSSEPSELLCAQSLT